MICPFCDGDGFIPRDVYEEHLDPSEMKTIPCPFCDGHGVILPTD